MLYINDMCAHFHIRYLPYISVHLYHNHIYEYGIIMIMLLELPAEFILGGPLLAAAADAHATSLKHADSASAAWSAR